ncbi:S8 family serine peptidase [Streptomyces sp. V1I6]|uniref:S8 family serine peptidase n=1 Tax=Streptomyces sp. V1I6 TaxID=3042273 RepID=UPI00278430D2|nr:S8 family serine peptidase [Streptomyces sp. V1I6]MDQ0847402.1 subtilisin family serine protease [Streptomyces sp. V1I6]
MVSTKLDELLIARAYEAQRTALSDDETARMDRLERIKVILHFTGDLDVIEEAGFWAEFHTARIAVGTINAIDLERVAELDNVVSIHSNRRIEPLGSSPDEPPHPAGPAAGDPIHAIPPHLTGVGVVVGILDSGIDIHHRAFRKLDGTTRIVSLYDMTLRQTIATTGNPTGGSVRLRWQPPVGQDQATGPLPFPLTAAAVHAALGQVGGLTPADLVVTGGPLPAQPVVIDFVGQYDGTRFDTRRINPIRLTEPTFTGGTQPKISVVRGRLITQNEINAALAAVPPPPPPPATPPPPPAFVSRDMVGHGSHVAGIAAGFRLPGCCSPDRTVGLAFGADLAIMRTTMTEAENIQGARHFFAQPWLAEGTPRPPAVLNISLGSSGSAHDGTADFDTALDDLLTGTTRRSVVVSAGNGGGLFTPPPLVPPRYQEGQHALGEVQALGTATTSFDVLFTDLEANTLVCWYKGPGRLNFTLTPPPSVGGQAMAPVAPSASPTPVEKVLGQGATAHTVSVTSYLSAPPSGKRLIVVRISPPAPTGNPPVPGRIAPSIWKMTLHETQGTATSFDWWSLESHTDDEPARFIPGDQNRTRTVTSPGSARLPITVGAYDTGHNNRLASFSSRGPTTDSRMKPEVCAPGVGIFSVAAGAQNPEHLTPQSGTSQAAPFVTGVIALMFEVNPNLDHTTIKGHLTSTCKAPTPPVPPTQLDSGWGHGMVDAEAAILAAMPHALAEDFAKRGEPLVLPAAAYPASNVPLVTRVRHVLARMSETPAGRRIAELGSTHHEEVRRLVDTERRVVVAWQRMHGPLLLRRLLLSDFAHDEPVPRNLAGRPVADGLARLLDELAAAGSPALREAVVEHREFLLELPGATWSDLDERAGRS